MNTIIYTMYIMSMYFDNKELFAGPKVSQYGSHMVMTNVTKTPKMKYVNIDTKFRDEYNTDFTTDYNISLPERITDVRSISVVNMEIPNTFFNISKNLGNNAMKITSSGTTEILVVRDGNYNETSLLVELNARKTELGTPFTNLVFDVSFNKITVTPSTGTFDFDFGVDSNGAFTKYNFKSRLGWLLGFRNQKYTGVASGSTLTSEYFYSLTGPRYLYLVVDEFTSNGNPNSFTAPLPSSAISKNILARISLDNAVYPFMQVIPANKSNGYLLSDVRSYTGKVDIQKLNVQLVNENGTAMNLNGADFSFCLQIEYE